MSSQLERKSGPTSGRQRYDLATSYRCRPDVGPTVLAGWDMTVRQLINSLLLTGSNASLTVFKQQSKRLFNQALTKSSLQHLKQIWSRRLFKHINKNLKLLKTLRYICHIILKTLLPKEILLSLSNISFGHNVFKSRLLQWRLYASPGDEVRPIHKK